MFRSKGDQVYYNDQYVATFSAPNSDAPEEIRNGESWLDMRKRTDPLRAERARRCAEMASIAAETFNTANLNYDSLA